MKKAIGLMLLIGLAFSLSEVEGQKIRQGEGFRVLGYLFVNEELEEEVNKIDWSSYTDINLAFVQPDSKGDFLENNGYNYLVENAHSNNVRAFISIGGGAPPEHLGDLMQSKHRSHWVQQIVNLVNNYDFDGVDVDLENALINEDYVPFVKELHKALKDSGKLMTAALASWNGDKISDEILGLYDYINIMSYDETGPWNLEIVGQHSPYKMAVNDIHYFHKVRAVPKSKLLLGLPFYGYGFGSGVLASLRYKYILEAYPNAYLQDSIVSNEGGVLYYNSPELIGTKTAMAKELELAGVMVWHITADAEGPHSLLKAINDER
ncbi:glycosyl hydrolase family 18 protein [Cyclobacterium sp. 1_MG-2023]|uniref:glycosyl hydrolase family 18 protein n=1 Tax=Cyclobacterium sp. 1_MG-2023 TaxID=3062681 RepID=UPI0026E4315F|nr:glycosyl hydrolase family 18 protein [Cyclobacterium sp. 1_MG-2023]MDO6438511.1 glycosyl hydrolase family 18 protein [Cyclobacterium sp. 1_MG-2023]